MSRALAPRQIERALDEKPPRARFLDAPPAREQLSAGASCQSSLRAPRHPTTVSPRMANTKFGRPPRPRRSPASHREKAPGLLANRRRSLDEPQPGPATEPGQRAVKSTTNNRGGRWNPAVWETAPAREPGPPAEGGVDSPRHPDEDPAHQLPESGIAGRVDERFEQPGGPPFSARARQARRRRRTRQSRHRRPGHDTG